MSRVTCAISGINFHCTYMDSINLPHTRGYFHPIFALPYTSLYPIYTAHTKGQLSPKDSYLLFLAFLHGSDQIDWVHPASCNPGSDSTIALIENNIAQLVRVLEKTAIIRHPSFSQPSFKVTYENSNLYQIPNWIAAWTDNIDRFSKGQASIKEQQDLQKVENKLTSYILSGSPTKDYAAIVAKWANLAACFPYHREEEWEKVIRSCFNASKMFNTPLPLIKEIKAYCEENIEVGSIHFHTLSLVLQEGINKHIDYLGGSSLALGYTLLPSNPSYKKGGGDKSDIELLAIAADAPLEEPVQGDYPSSLEFLKAKLAYRVASSINTHEPIEPITNEKENIL